ncbi:hypothetical protein OGAPHI_004997 [Ogataea philodendri]|uniref:Uncharacterized protein n=1 Tax=Ogataea philodendri TaxID=1378263 RepID=A0A9P8P243_9ASCO|nr:uncharacterized protein OGAPHI_004997 [Ogataea philodendri]KAH3663596.1 hypothetical protein OGAPHI_004997 [Ogataea philodendri]
MQCGDFAFSRSDHVDAATLRRSQTFKVRSNEEVAICWVKFGFTPNPPIFLSCSCRMFILERLCCFSRRSNVPNSPSMVLNAATLGSKKCRSEKLAAPPYSLSRSRTELELCLSRSSTRIDPSYEHDTISLGFSFRMRILGMLLPWCFRCVVSGRESVSSSTDQIPISPPVSPPITTLRVVDGWNVMEVIRDAVSRSSLAGSLSYRPSESILSLALFTSLVASLVLIVSKKSPNETDWPNLSNLSSTSLLSFSSAEITSVSLKSPESLIFFNRSSSSAFCLASSASSLAFRSSSVLACTPASRFDLRVGTGASFFTFLGLGPLLFDLFVSSGNSFLNSRDNVSKFSFLKSSLLRAIFCCLCLSNSDKATMVKKKGVRCR